MIIGIAERLCFFEIEDLALELQKLKPENALIYGICMHDKAKVVTKKALAREQAKNRGNMPVVARDREHFSYPKGPAVLMIDYDPCEGKEPLTRDELRNAVYSIAPAIECAPHLLTVSASSCIYKGDECLRGTRGLRMLVIVACGTDIPRAGVELFKRSWIAGYGYFRISKSGALLERSIVDVAVYQPERLDFCGGAWCQKPLEQRRPDLQVFCPDAEPLDTLAALPSLNNTEEETFEQVKLELMREAKPEANRVQDLWIEERVKQIAAKDPSKGEATREIYTQAAKHRRLNAEFELTLDDGKRVTVGEVLGNRDEYNERRCADPLEPDYDDDPRIAFMNLKVARPYIYSHAHGGTRYELIQRRSTIVLADGRRAENVRRCLTELHKNGRHYSRGGEIVTISSETKEILPRDKEGLRWDLDISVRFEKIVETQNSVIHYPKDCPLDLAKGILAAKGEWGLPNLTGIATAPTMDPATGRIIDADGFDIETGLIVILGDNSGWKGVPDNPTDVHVERSVQGLLRPFREFPFDGRVSKGVFLQTILTAVLRGLLPTAPGTAIDSPVPGSGKTLLTKCLAVLAGEVPAILPDASDNEEIRKRLLALLRRGKRVLILDNITGTLDSSALCGMLTSELYEDRVLGVTESVIVPTRTLLLISGNNIALRGDLCRRVLRCRIDPDMEAPWKRRFELDPLQYCREHRVEMIRDALVILRVGIERGPELPDKTASFELWSDTVRRAVCFVGNMDMIDVDDPVKSIDESFSMDPETMKLGTLMSAWAEVFRARAIKSAELITAATEGRETSDGFTYIRPELHAAVDEIAGKGRSINARILGWWIEKHRDRIVWDLKIVEAGESHRAKLWKVVSG